MLGVRIEEFFPLHEGESIALDAFGSGSIFSELGAADGAEALAHFADGPVAGSVAISRNPVGTGAAYYVATRLSDEGTDELLGWIANDAGLAAPFELQDDVEVVRRSNGEASWLFVINHSSAEATLATTGVELISGDPARGTLVVPAGKVAVVRQTDAQ
jgi:beta-galactosidase